MSTNNRNDFSIKNFKDFIFSTENELKTLPKEEIVNYLEEKTKSFVDADHAIFSYLDEEDQSYHSPTLKKRFTICKDRDCATKEAIEKKQPILIQNVSESILYDEHCDNFFGVDIKDILIYTIFKDRTTDKYPQVIFCCATNANSSRIISQKKTLYLLKFIDTVSPYIKNINLDESSLRQLTLEQCIENSDKLERMLNRNNQYFHSIIHDIRTPMNALLGFLELLSNHENDSSKKEYLHSALKSGEQMVRLISDALEVAKIEKGELPIDRQPFNVFEEFGDTIKIFYETARKKNILLTAFIDPTIPREIVSDSYRIKQVLSNLLSNAIKFTPEYGSIYVEFIFDEKKDTLTVSVKDTGAGIAKENQKNIFMPYRQEEDSTERNYGGTGLGLSISQQIVALLGGKLSLESELGKGSRFYFTIPVRIADKKKYFNLEGLSDKKVDLFRWKKRKDIRAKTIEKYLIGFGVDYKRGDQEESLSELVEKQRFNTIIIEHHSLKEEEYEELQHYLDLGGRVIWIEDVFDTYAKRFAGEIFKVPYPVLPNALYEAFTNKPKQTSLKTETKSEKKFQGKKVLVVDDNRINLKLMEEVLKNYHLEYELASDAETALNLLELSHFDLIFMDENMPKMLGSEAIKIIREKINRGELSELKIVSLSGDSDHKKEILEAGADLVLTKPIQLNKLSSIFEDYLQ